MDDVRRNLLLDLDLLGVALVTLAVVILVTLMPTLGPLRVALGIPFVLFCPGYAVVASLYPRRGQLDPLERVALGFGVSLAVAPLLGLLLHFTPWGITLYSFLTIASISIVAGLIAAYYRRAALPPGERFQVDMSWSIPHVVGSPLLNLLLVAGLTLAVVGLAGVLAWRVGHPAYTERFSEFYVLGQGGKAEGYPQKLQVRERTTVTLGIINQEGKTTRYTFQAQVFYEQASRPGEVLATEGPFELAPQGRQEIPVTIALPRTGVAQQVRFILLRDGDPNPYRTVHFWVDVE